MHTLLLLFVGLFLHTESSAVAPDNDDIKNAKIITNTSGFCTVDAEFNNIDATASRYIKANAWASEGKDVWFKFIAKATDVNVSIDGKNAVNANTLVTPQVAIYTFENNVLAEQIGSTTKDNNLTTAYKGGLIIGNTYYIRVSAENEATGTFKLCINNYNSPKKAGQDCATAAILCSKETITERFVSGAGNNSREAAGSCLVAEANSSWYHFTANNNGTLTFTITPTSTTDDIDWVLYDLGPTGDCQNLLPVNAIRCAAGSGVNCSPRYFITVMNMDATDLSERSNCVAGQDGMVKYVDMISGHTYALLVENFSNNGNGFTLAFGGTAEFTGPKATIKRQNVNACISNQTFIFNAEASNFTSLNWSFGDGASVSESTANGPHLISYTTPGYKTVTLTAKGTKDCNVISVETFYVATKPAIPIITSNKPSFCINDKIELSINEVADATYQWKGPNNFSAETATITIPVTNLNQAGNYRVVTTVGECSSEPGVFTIPTIVKNPTAAFRTDPQLPGKFSVPFPIKFLNQSKDAVDYLWDFGDGETDDTSNPSHTFTKEGKFTVTLTAFTANGCSHHTSISNLVVLPSGALLIPDAFSPNGDGINDEFTINMSNLKKYKLTVFNRYGTILFNSFSVFSSWNGTYKGSQLPVGTYFYQIIAEDLYNNDVRYSGSVTLLR